ncbi:hypothetical protein J6590_028441, partial [Homalodisca vitripennis]
MYTLSETEAEAALPVKDTVIRGKDYSPRLPPLVLPLLVLKSCENSTETLEGRLQLSVMMGCKDQVLSTPQGHYPALTLKIISSQTDGGDGQELKGAANYECEISGDKWDRWAPTHVTLRCDDQMMTDQRSTPSSPLYPTTTVVAQLIFRSISCFAVYHSPISQKRTLSI